jgi:hypothetical protein
MPKQFDALIQYLNGTKDAWLPSTTSFPELNIEQLWKDLELERSEEGPEDLELSGQDPEEKIIDNIKIRLRRAKSDYDNTMNVYESRLSDSVLHSEGYLKIKAASEGALANIEAQLEEDYLLLEKERQKTELVCLQFNDFVNKNGLERMAPILKTPNETLSHLSIILILILVETVFNGIFFAQGSQLGLIGGMVEAVGLSLVNISFAAVLGVLAVKEILHINRNRRFAGISFSIMILLTLVAFNAFIAHYREFYSLSMGVQVSIQQVVGNLINNPLGLNDSRSWTLGFIGLIISLFAAYKFFKFSDPYPGFTSIGRRREEAIRKLDDLAKQCMDVIGAHKDDAISGMETVIKSLEDRKVEFNLAGRSRSRFHESYLQHISMLEESAFKLVNRFRREKRIKKKALRNEFVLTNRPTLDSDLTTDSKLHSKTTKLVEDYIMKINRAYVDGMKNISELGKKLSLE